MRLEQDPRGEPATARLNYTTHRLGRALDRFCENLALAHGVTLSQFLVLQVLAEGLPMTNAQLARRTFVSSQAAHSVCKELLDASLIERGRHPTNQRMRLVRLTDEGWELVRMCHRELKEYEDRLTAALQGETQEPLTATMDRAAEVLAGGYFGDDEAEAAAIARRTSHSRPRQVPTRLAASRLREIQGQDLSD